MGEVTSKTDSDCRCGGLSDVDNIPMGFDGDDERFFATVNRIQDHGGTQWWLYLSQCESCGQHWVIAQEERIFDEYLVRRITKTDAQAIVSKGDWPNEFLQYEKVLRTLRTRSSYPIWFDLNDSPLARTITELRQENPDLSIVEAAELIGVDRSDLVKLRFD